jgi:crossover junction endodeoxyribonuclease RuvC
MPIILGIDPGTQVTGYGVIRREGRILTPIDYGCIRTSPKLSLPARYKIIFESVEELIKKFSPDALSIETQFVYKNAQSALKVGMARGVVLVAAERAGIAIFEYTPTKAKNAVVGKGNASKTEVQTMIQRLLCLSTPPTPEDAADALALAVCLAQTQEQF